MKASSIAKLTQYESTLASAQSSSSTDQSAPASGDELALLQFRRLLADYRRAGYEYAHHVYSKTRR